MKVHEILQQNTDLLRALARAGAAIEDVRYIPLWNDYERLRRDGFSERTVYRIIRRFGRDVNTSR